MNHLPDHILSYILDLTLNWNHRPSSIRLLNYRRVCRRWNRSIFQNLKLFLYVRAEGTKNGQSVSLLNYSTGERIVAKPLQPVELLQSMHENFRELLHSISLIRILIDEVELVTFLEKILHNFRQSERRIQLVVEVFDPKDQNLDSSELGKSLAEAYPRMQLRGLHWSARNSADRWLAYFLKDQKSIISLGVWRDPSYKLSLQSVGFSSEASVRHLRTSFPEAILEICADPLRMAQFRELNAISLTLSETPIDFDVLKNLRAIRNLNVFLELDRAKARDVLSRCFFSSLEQLTLFGVRESGDEKQAIPCSVHNLFRLCPTVSPVELRVGFRHSKFVNDFASAASNGLLSAVAACRIVIRQVHCWAAVKDFFEKESTRSSMPNLRALSVTSPSSTILAFDSNAILLRICAPQTIRKITFNLPLPRRLFKQPERRLRYRFWRSAPVDYATMALSEFFEAAVQSNFATVEGVVKVDWYDRLFVQTPALQIEQIPGFTSTKELSSRVLAMRKSVETLVMERYATSTAVRFDESLYLSGGCSTEQSWKGTFSWKVPAIGDMEFEEKRITLIAQPRGVFNVVENGDVFDP